VASRKIPKKRSPVKRRKAAKTAKSTRKKAASRKKTAKKPSRAKVWLDKTLERGERELKQEKAKWEGMSRHTDAEGFTILKPEHRRLTRSEAAKLGWINRKSKELQSKGVSYLGSRDWAQLSSPRAKSLETLSQDTLGPYAFVYGKQRQRFVKSALETRDRRVVLYMNLAHEMGYTIRQARTALFSPRAVKVG